MFNQPSEHRGHKDFIVMADRYVDFNIKDASKVFFTSDTHFFHENILKSCHRPFSSIKEMDSVLIDNWNKVVPQDGIVFHLGDFAWGNKLQMYQDLIPKLNGEIILIKGNHDEKNLPRNREECLKLFKMILPQGYGKIEGRYVYLNHYPFLCYGGIYRDPKDLVYQLFGHVHSGKMQTGLDMPRMNLLLPTQYDVGVDNNNYTPISWYDVAKKIETQVKNKKNMTMWWR